MTDAHTLPDHSPQGLPQRLAEVAGRMGGKRALARAAGLSEAQLFRYLNGESDMAVSKLTAIAGAANVSANWLLTGDGEAIIVPPQPAGEPSFNPTIMETLTQQLDELLIEYQQRLTPRQRARGLTFLYQALRQDELTHGQHASIDRRLLLELLEYYDNFRNDDMLHIFRSAWTEQDMMPALNASQLVEMTQAAALLTYDGFTGKSYFNRVTTQASPASKQRLHNLISLFGARTEALSFLDLGTGNGREMAFVHQNYPHVSVHGIELSSRGIAIANGLIKSHQLPEGCLHQGSILSLSHEDASVHLINSRMCLQNIPFIANTGVGAEQMFAEVARVLKPSGYFSLVTFAGEGCTFAPFVQKYSQENLEHLARVSGLKLLSCAPHDMTTGMSESSAATNKAATHNGTFVEALFQKP